MKHNTNWKDLFYFSSGERRALSILLGLIVCLCIAMAVGGNRQKPATENKPAAQVYRQSKYPRQEKFPVGTVVELNTADTTTLKKIPGIGSSYAKRITGYRRLLGGFYSVEQLREVYGMDEERFLSLSPWFRADASLIRRLSVNTLPADSLAKHPYINYRQANAIVKLRKRRGTLRDWNSLRLLEEFTKEDMERLLPYVAF
jgi:competence ComEA-like helix-hairpin-helix protein